MISDEQIKFYNDNGYVKDIKVIEDKNKIERLRIAVIDILTGKKTVKACQTASYNLKL